VQTVSKSDVVKRLFEIGESQKSDEFMNFFTEDATYQFGNAAPVIGRKAIQDAVANFFPLVKTLYHDIKGTYEFGALLLVEMDVIYTRHDGKVVTIPVADTFRFEGGLIKGLQIYGDTSPVFA
jgi:ketosteroid isomerase-like protein